MFSLFLAKVRIKFIRSFQVLLILNKLKSKSLIIKESVDYLDRRVKKPSVYIKLQSSKQKHSLPVEFNSESVEPVALSILECASYFSKVAKENGGSLYIITDIISLHDYCQKLGFSCETGLSYFQSRLSNMTS